MDDFAQRITLDLEKTPQNFFISPMILSNPYDLTRIRNIQNFESPLFTYKDILKTNLSFLEPQGIAPLPKDDDFKLDNNDQVKVESTTSQMPNHIEHPQLEISFESALNHRHPDNLGNYNQITRSRGPSFHLATGVADNENMIPNPLELYSLIHRELPDRHGDLNVKFEAHDHHGVGEYSFEGLQASPALFAQKGKYPLDLQYSFLPGVFDLNHIRVNQLEQHAAEMGQDAQGGFGVDMKPKPKKKKKLNNGEAGSADINSPKLKKSKSEGKKPTFAAVTHSGNSMKVKITKTSDGKTTTSNNTTPMGNKAKKIGKAFGSDEKGAEGGADDKSTEISSNISMTKLEDLPQFSKAKSMMSGSTKPSESKDLLQGFHIPSEIEEYIHNNGILNHINLSSSTRKIGTLTVEERRIKIEKYLQKRKKRTWSKKISYDCRKRVADSRLRIKGRFVTKEQAFAMLGSDTGGRELGEITTSEIKNLLNQKFGGLGNKKKDIKDKEKGGLDKKLEDKLEDNESSNELD